ncbi:MAG: cyclodeaminase/cyclohydrolase family protein [Patescibacteria group bacterium]
MSINSQTLEKFQKDLSSKNPTPGGGVIAALSGSFAASLIEMVCNLTIDKKGYEKVQKDIIKIHKDAVDLKKKLTKLVEDDKKAFDKVMVAYKSAKNLPAQAGKTAIRKSLKYAIAVPMEVRKLSQILEKLAYHVSKIGNKNTLSDAKTAIHLARAASKSALENIKINKQALVKLQSLN